MRQPQEIVERVLDASRSDGCMVIVEDDSMANVRWANSSLTTDGVSTTRRVTVLATVERPTGTGVGAVSNSGAMDDGALVDLVAAAEAAAREAAPAPDAQPLVPGDAVGTTWSAPVPPTSMDVFGAMAPALGEAFAAARSRQQHLFGYAEHRVRGTFLGSSKGARLRHDQPYGHVELTGRSGGGSAWAGAATRDFSDVAVDELYAQIDERLRRGSRRIELPPGRYECILPPAAVADLMNYVYWSAGARDAVQGQTVYSRPGGGTRIGEQLTDVPLTLRGDPGAPGLECLPFVLAHASDGTVSVFDNGLPLQPTSWVDGGRLRALLQTRHTAQETGLPLTPHIDNLILEGPARGSLADMIAATERGLLLTSLWYIREVDPQTLLLTGLTRDGVYLVEQGEIVGGVNNFRFNESPLSLLARVKDVGTTVLTRAREWGDAFTRTAMPPLRVADFNMSSISQAI